MTAEAKQELDKKNREYLAKKKARRAAVAASKNDPKASRSAVSSERQPEVHGSHAAQIIEHVTLKAQRKSVKVKWPKIRGLADATAQELAQLLAQGEKEPQMLIELQATWAKRAHARHEAWLKGNSKSAQAARKKPVTA